MGRSGGYIIIILILLTFTSYSDGLKAEKRITIGFGKEENKIGIDTGGGEHWKPLFFSIDKTGFIHIPDFYKSRIAVFDGKGKLVAQKSCKEGISPRMNYFCLTPHGPYVTYSDYTLFLLNEDGSVKWKSMLGYGMIPRFLWANDLAIFIVFPGKDERAIVFDYLSSRPIGRFGFKAGEESIPMVMSKNKTQFTLTIDNMQKIPGMDVTNHAFNLEENAFLLFIDNDDKTLWKRRQGETEYIYLFSKSGGLEKEGVIHFPETEIEGTGFWTVCDNELHIYKNYFYENHMEIAVYSFK
ncbi:MAG: hypothetical protein JW881_21155 [Spirochaetales bacterium]|nr:hypothetical protein [Spirochaetales bacterium]